MFPIELTTGVIPNTGVWGDKITLTNVNDCDWGDINGFCVGESGDLELLFVLGENRCGFKDPEFMYECVGPVEHEGPHFPCEDEKLSRVPLAIARIRSRSESNTKIS